MPTKNSVPLDAQVVEAELAKLETLVDSFAASMKSRLIAKVREGWQGWDQSSEVGPSYTALLAHATGVPFAYGHEVDVANYAMFLWFLHGGAQ